MRRPSADRFSAWLLAGSVSLRLALAPTYEASFISSRLVVALQAPWYAPTPRPSFSSQPAAKCVRRGGTRRSSKHHAHLLSWS